MHARARGVENSTYTWLDKPNENRGQIKRYGTDTDSNTKYMNINQTVTLFVGGVFVLGRYDVVLQRLVL